MSFKDTVARLSKNRKVITLICLYMHKNSSTSSNNTAPRHYLHMKHLHFKHDNNSTPGVLIEEIWKLMNVASCLNQTIMTICGTMGKWMCVYMRTKGIYISSLWEIMIKHNCWWHIIHSYTQKLYACMYTLILAICCA